MTPRRPHRRPHRRPRTAASLLVLALLATGCGSEDDPGTAADPSAGPSGSPSDSPSGSPSGGLDEVPAPSEVPGGPSNPGAPDAEAVVLDVVALPRGGGQVTEELSVLEGAAQQRSYAAGFAPPVRADLRAALAGAAVPAGRELGAAAVASGCEEPTATRLQLEDGRWVVEADLPRSSVQCLVATTYVVLAAVPA